MKLPGSGMGRSKTRFMVLKHTYLKTYNEENDFLNVKPPIMTFEITPFTVIVESTEDELYKSNKHRSSTISIGSIGRDFSIQFFFFSF